MDTAYFNPYTGDYIFTWPYGVNESLGDGIIWLQVSLHDGTYWGWGAKILWDAAGLAIPLLAATGLLMHWNRAREEDGKSSTSASQPRPPRRLESRDLRPFRPTLFVFAQSL